MRIRPAVRADARAIAEINVAGWRAAYRGLLPDGYLAALDVEERTARQLAHFAAPSAFRRLVAEDGDTVTGFVIYGPYRAEQDSAGPVDDTVGEILAIYVAPERWGAGTGQALMDAAVADLAGRGVTEIRLWVLAGNERSRRFYERYGFRHDGEVDTFVYDDGSGAGAPEVRYALVLTGSPDADGLRASAGGRPASAAGLPSSAEGAGSSATG